jgi:hypothetical protein
MEAEGICPYCGEPISVELDELPGRQELVEDCWVCCRPIEVIAVVEDGEVQVELRRSDE